MRTFNTLGKKKVVLGLVHLRPLPGTPFHEEGNLDVALDKAIKDSTALYEGGADGCLIQTVDRVYPTDDEADYARVAAMTKIVHEVSRVTGPGFQIGVQIMVNALKASLAVAKVCGGSYLRCMAFVGQTKSAWGLVKSNPHDFLQYRAYIGANHIQLIAEVDGMHFHWDGNMPTSDIALRAYRLGAAAVEIAHKDEDTNIRVAKEIKNAHPEIPIILGGYTTHENAARRLAYADGAFVGSCLEEGGRGGYVDIERVKEYVGIVSNL